MKSYVVYCLFQVPVDAEDKDEAEKIALDILNPNLMHVSDSDFKVEHSADFICDDGKTLDWLEEVFNG